MKDKSTKGLYNAAKNAYKQYTGIDLNPKSIPGFVEPQIINNSKREFFTCAEIILHKNTLNFANYSSAKQLHFGF